VIPGGEYGVDVRNDVEIRSKEDKEIFEDLVVISLFYRYWSNTLDSPGVDYQGTSDHPDGR
jgi:hypothetical protein